MRDCMNTVSDFSNVREAVCISTQKIMDACRDQDCMENVPVYLTRESQETLECATSVKARCAELIYADVDVEPVCYQDGHYCVNIQYFYKVIADVTLCGVRPATIYGLAVTSKQAMLYGGENCARTFASSGPTNVRETPRAVVSAVDPVLLSACIEDMCHCKCGQIPCCCCGGGMPTAVENAFDDELVFTGMNRQLVVTLGQFALIRLEQETQLLIPSYDYCMPSKECREGSCGNVENPCQAFSRMQFPMNAFFPTREDTEDCHDRESSCGCGCGSARSGGSRQESCHEEEPTACEAAAAVAAAAQRAADSTCQSGGHHDSCGCGNRRR